MSHIWMCAHSCSLSLSLSLPVALSPCRSFSLSFSLPFALSPFRSLSLSLSLSTHWVGDDLMRIDSVALQWNIECVLEFVKFRFILGAQGAAVCTACIALVVIGRLVECQTKITCWICDIQMPYWCGGAVVCTAPALSSWLFDASLSSWLFDGSSSSWHHMKYWVWMSM